MPDGSFQIRSFVDVDAPGCYVWKNPEADGVLRAAGIAPDQRLLKIGYATRIRPPEADAATPAYAELPGWEHWRCAMWERPENLDEMERRLSRYFKPLPDDVRALLYRTLAPHVLDIPAGLKLCLGSALDAALHFPFCARTGTYKLPLRERPADIAPAARQAAPSAFQALFGAARHA
jgi:hypothetical protein